MATEAQRAAIKRHLAKLDQITVRFEAGTKEQIALAAKRAGVPRNTYIVQAVEARLEKDK